MLYELIDISGEDQRKSDSCVCVDSCVYVDRYVYALSHLGRVSHRSPLLQKGLHAIEQTAIFLLIKFTQSLPAGSPGIPQLHNSMLDAQPFLCSYPHQFAAQHRSAQKAGHTGMSTPLRLK